MMRKLTLILGALCGLYGSAQAQLCGFDQVHRQMLTQDPAYAQRVAATDAHLAQMVQNNANSLIVNTPNGPVYEIPVVIHVVHTGGAVGTMYNPADATLQGMINYLNASYAATWASYPSATTGGTAFPIQFVLAKRTPGCATTSNGIVRVDGSAALGTAYTNNGVNISGTAGVSDATLKTVSVWSHHDYYNIWVVNRIDGNNGTSGTFTAGYAYYPNTPASLDGTVMLATQSVAGNITLPHEIGHAFALRHVFEGDDPGGTGSATTCPSNANCLTQGDMVCDTEPMRRSPFNCPTGTNSCTGVAYANGQRNFMDYSSCQDRFTPGQRTRFMNALISDRSGLISSLGATAIGTTTVTAATCAPTITLPTNTSNAGPRNVELNDMFAPSEGGYNSDGNQVYLDRSCIQRANITAGLNYTINVTTGGFRQYVRVYIDYNNDGAFNATTELAFSSNGTTATPLDLHSGTINIPSTAVTCTPIRMRVITDRFSTGTPPAPCAALSYGQAEDYSIVVKPARPAVSLAFASGSANPSCAGSALTFNATNGGTPGSPVWRWYLNGNFTGATTASYTSSSLVTGDVVTATLSYTTACGVDSVTTTGIVVNRGAVVSPAVSIAVTAGTNPGCAGLPITFTATPTNGGSAPTYQWYVGTVLQTGVTGNSFTSSALNCNNVVSAVMTSNSACASVPTASSNAITFTCGTAPASVTMSVTGGSNPTCAGRAVTFTANPVNGGNAPLYQWFVNGVAVVGATGVSYTNNTYATGDSVYVQLTSNYVCVANTTAVSPAAYLLTIPSVTPYVTKAITAGSNPGCEDSLVQFTATALNGGPAPSFRWFVNGIQVGVNSVYDNTTANDGDLIWVRMTPSGIGSSCFSRDTAYSDTTVLQRKATPKLPFISFIGHDLVSDSANVQWYGPAGLIPGAVGATYSPTATGTYYAVIRNPLCGTGQSNILIVNPLSVGSYNMQGVALFPNPTTGRLTITWTSAATTRIQVTTATGQVVLRDMATLTTSKVLDLSKLASGVYFVNLEDEHGNKGAVRVTVAH